MAKPCPNCGTPNQDTAAFCDQCGSKLTAGNAPGAASAYQAPSPYPAPAGGVNCPSCGTANLPGTLFCDQCGASLVNIAPAPMQPPPLAPSPSPYVPPPSAPAGMGFQQPAIPSVQPPVVPAAPSPMPPAPPVAPGAAAVSGQPPATCRLTIGGQPIQVPTKSEVIVGRADAASGWMPDVDLTPFGATPEAGVSRKHIKLVWQGGWMIEDLNSVNGTFLRGQRLTPQQRTPLGSGETFQLGKLQVIFVID